MYQNADLKLDFTKQIKRNDDFISKLLKDLSKKSFMVIAASNTLGQFQELNIYDKKVNVTKRGAVIRTGDIIKIGRVPIMIKESTIDAKRFEQVQRENTTTMLNYFDIRSDADADHSERNLGVKL